MPESEYRQDPVTGRWVVIAAHRSDRPLEFHSPPVRKPNRICPFCAGNEQETPNAILELPNESDEWQVRVVPNLFPAFDRNTYGRCDEPPKLPRQTHKLHKSKPAVGLHEVIIESRVHVSSITQLSAKDAGLVFTAYGQRLGQISQDGTAKAALLFKNCGVAAGISLEHVHSQLVALPIVPPTLEQELKGARDWYEAHQRCVFCEAAEKADDRIIETTDDYVVYCPYASRFPYEMVIQPRQHSCHFHQHAFSRPYKLAEVVLRTLKRLENLLTDVSYNVLFHSAPFDGEHAAYYHWHIEILPRIATVAGLEWGGGIHINVVRPESAAEQLAQSI